MLTMDADGLKAHTGSPGHNGLWRNGYDGNSRPHNRSRALLHLLSASIVAGELDGRVKDEVDRIISYWELYCENLHGIG